MSSYERLLAHINEIQDLRKTIRVLTWDREVNMPRGGERARANQISTVSKLCHQLFTSDETGELIEAAQIELNGAGPGTVGGSLIRHLKREYGQARKLPAEFVSQKTAVHNGALAAWKRARSANDFPHFQPWLHKLVTIARQQANYLGFEDEPYDALLDVYEPGAKTTRIRQLFNNSKRTLRPLYRTIRQRNNQVNDGFLHQNYDIAGQRAFARYLAEVVGYDFDRGHLASAVHPFSTSLSRDDVRITTRYIPDFINPAIFATLHEAGHAIYVQNVDQELTRTPLAKETSAALDESQSRMIENIVGRSLGFWLAHLPRLKELFPSQLDGISAQDFFRAINRVKPGLIRVDADELTYNLHIFLRFELELALVNGDLQIGDLPAAWNDKMAEYLGITPPNDTQGCLQDIHWPMVGFGYFPSYALGNLYAAQLYESALDQNPSIREELARGEIGLLMQWLKENVHRHGRKYPPEEIIQMATGSGLSERAFVRYAESKFGSVYQL